MGDGSIDGDGSYAGQGIHSGYSIDHASATLAVSTTEDALEPITAAGTQITDALGAAEAALPAALSDAIARLTSLRETHVADVSTIRTFADACVSAAKSCLAAYEDASAEQVAETARAQRNIVFENSGLFGNTFARWERSINGTMPKKQTATQDAWSYERTSTANDDGSSRTSTTKRTTAADGLRTVVTDSHASSRRGPVSTFEHTYSEQRTSRGLTDTETYYSGSSHRGVNGPDTSAFGRTYSVTDGETTLTETEGTMGVTAP